MAGMRFDVITVFPGLIEPMLHHGVVGRAIDRGLLEVHSHDLREHAHDRHRQVDDAPFGGGAGMVMKPEPVFEAVEAVRPHNQGPVVLFEPWGQRLDQALVRELAEAPSLVLICGRYEGVDDRVREALADREVSIGGYVLSGGELPALVLIDAVARLLPGVLGDVGSLAQDSYGDDLVGDDSRAGQPPRGYPQFTRPAEYRGMKVPEVLLSGDHSRIRDWRRRQASTRRAALSTTTKEKRA